MQKKLKESIVQRQVSDYMKKNGYLVVKIIQTTLNGWPDLQCHKDGQTIFIETKSEGGKLSELQKYRHEQLQSKGFIVLTISNVNDVKVCTFLPKK